MLHSKLPGDLVDFITDFKPRDRDMKSPTAALVKEKMGYFAGEEHPVFWIKRNRWHPGKCGWAASAHVFQLFSFLKDTAT